MTESEKTEVTPENTPAKPAVQDQKVLDRSQFPGVGG